MTQLLYFFLLCLVPLSALNTYTRPKPRSTCARPEIAHGTARLKQRGRMARYECFSSYQLVGDKYATCYAGQWDLPPPVCVHNGCDMPKIENAIIMPTHKNAWLTIFCLPGYAIQGSSTIFCDGRQWNATAPTCVTDHSDALLSCDFESSSICGWTQDSRHDFDWTRINKKTPSAFLFTGPAFDHTYGEGRNGYFMYIESSSKTVNDTARLISPVYSGGLNNISCFSFFYHMYGRSIGGLRVYQIPETQKDQILDESDTKNQYLLFEKWGNQGDIWYRNVSYLRDVSDNFQIVIEGIRGTSFTSDIAIDDVAILSGQQCHEAFATAVTPAEDLPDSCAGRCSETLIPQRGCGCSASCISDSDCCADFLDLCVFSPDYVNRDDDETSASDQPMTEKLIASTRAPYHPTTTTTSTTTTTTTTTRKPTTTTPKPTTTTVKTTTVQMGTVPPRPRPRPVRSTTASPPKMTTAKLTTKVVTTTRKVTTTATRTAEKAQKIVEPKKGAEGEGSSGAAVGVVLLILFVVIVVATALVSRSARGRAAIARLRGRATSDPEVRYLTSDDH